MTEDSARKDVKALAAARDEFITQWGAIGSAWGINRTMAQIHALLLTSTEPLSTDQVMEELRISRGNAHSNLRDLAGWGLTRSVIRKGERKEFFEAEKDVWKMFCTIARERRRREIEPALDVLDGCREASKGLRTKEAKAFYKQMNELKGFLKLLDTVLEKISHSDESKTVQWAQKLLA